ncbi:TIMELESS-interacting protein [Copidosoma floridanum]|uniref:TIMELESS-interacting protein n=1 Tax=Copidosoma floridanum TaxID=29053 RepID=UPI0006C93F8A|nr:TIMELESS-interacting protein [Copidosoma floridanum]
MSESDAPLSAAEDDDVGVDDIVRQHENNDNEVMQQDEDADVSMEEVKVPEDDDDEANTTAQKVDPKKRVVRKLVVLNTERLKSRKGVHTLEKLYQGFEFHGKGHESEDLSRLMKKLEYWAFRLFPKLEFDDFLAKCESLGHKKDLHTHLKKYRLGMIGDDYDPVAEDDANGIIVENEEEDDTAETEAEAAAAAERDRELRDRIANENFERLLAEAVERPTEF